MEIDYIVIAFYLKKYVIKYYWFSHRMIIPVFNNNLERVIDMRNSIKEILISLWRATII